MATISKLRSRWNKNRIKTQIWEINIHLHMPLVEGMNSNYLHIYNAKKKMHRIMASISKSQNSSNNKQNQNTDLRKVFALHICQNTDLRKIFALHICHLLKK